MFYLLRAKSLPSILAAAFFLLIALQSFAQSAGDEGIRADLPADGVLRVENNRGGVSVEVWAERYVSVTAHVTGLRPKSSPVIIERTDGELKIGVARQEIGSAPSRVDLILRIPERAHAQVTTTTGEIVINGAPAELIGETVSGNIQASFSQSSGVKITADAATGNTSFENCAPPSQGEDIYRVCRIGA